MARFRAELLKPYQRNFVTRGKPRAAKVTKRQSSKQQLARAKTHTAVRSPKTVKQIVKTLKRILDTAVDDQPLPPTPLSPVGAVALSGRLSAHTPPAPACEPSSRLSTGRWRPVK